MGHKVSAATVLLFAALTALPCAADDVIGLCLGDDMRQRLQAEMKGLLQAVHGVHAGLAERNFDAVATTAEAAGSAMVGQVEAHGAHHHGGLPHEFVKLGRATHAAFDDLAAVAREGGRPRELLPALSKVTGHCVECHQQFRLAPAADCVTEEPATQ